MILRVSQKRTRKVWLLIILIITFGIGLVGQEQKIDWNKIRKNAESYYTDPSRENALQFYHSLPESPVPRTERGPSFNIFGEYFYNNLGVLEKQVMLGVGEAVRLAFRSYSISDGFLEHQLDMILGDYIRVDPNKFLKEFRLHPQGTGLSLKYGWILCDGRLFQKLGPHEVCQELDLRIKALETIQNGELVPVRDECINTIAKEVSKKTEFILSFTIKTLSGDVVDEFLRSPYIEAQRRAFDYIISHQDKFLPALREKLGFWQDMLKSVDYLDKLLYLAAIFRHESLVPPLEEMIRDREFMGFCIYECPLVFTLSIYGHFAEWKPSSDLDKTWTTVSDVFRAIEILGEISYKREDPRDYVKGPGIDSLLNKMIKLKEEELIKIASPQNSNSRERIAAAYTLRDIVDNSKNLYDLYWLAINDLPMDASAEYRRSIYYAIYRAEKARLAGR